MHILSKDKILKDFLSLFSGRLFGAGLNFLTMVLLMSRLTVSEFGQFTYLFALMGGMQLCMDVGLDNSFVSLAAESYSSDRACYERREKSFLNLKLLLCLPLVLVSLGTWLVTGDRLLLAVMLSSIPLGLADTVLTFLRVRGDFKRVGALVAAVNALRLAVVAGLALAGGVSLYTVMYGYVAANLVYLLICFCSARLPSWQPMLDRETIRQVFIFTKWLFLYNVSIMLMMRMEIFFLKLYVSGGVIPAGELGVYGAAFRLAFFLPLLTTSLTAALLPKVAQIKDRAGLDHYLKKIGSLIVPVAGILALAVLLSWPLFHYGFAGKYDSSIPVFRLLLVGVGSSVFANTMLLVFYSTKQFNLLACLSGLQLVANTLLDLLLIRYYGAMGAAMAMVAVRLIGIAVVSYFVTYRIQFRYDGDAPPTNSKTASA